MDNKEIRLTNLWHLIAEFETKRALAERIGISPNFLAQITTGHRAVGDEFARKIEKELRKPRGWMDVLHPNVVPADIPALKRVPLLDWEALKAPAPIKAKAAETWLITDATMNPKAFALQVHGDAMLNPHGVPTYPNGARIIVDPDRAAEEHDRVVVLLAAAEKALFRQLTHKGKVLWLKPLNPAYPAMRMPEDAKIVGVVVQTIIDA